MSSKEHDEGRRAFQAEKSDTDCPYPSSTSNELSLKRTLWFNGFFEAQIAKRLRKCFRKNKVKWP